MQSEMAALFYCLDIYYYMYNDIEIPWQTFIMLPEMRKLSLNEQRLQYHYYIQSFERTRQNLHIQTLNTVPDAGLSPLDIPRSSFLLQENGDYILQEDGSRIRLA